MSEQRPEEAAPNKTAALSYASVYPSYGSAPTLVRVAMILLYVMAGLDLFGGLGVAAAILLKFFVYHAVPVGAGHPPPPDVWVRVVIDSGIAILCCLEGALLLVAATKLVRRSRNAWGLALAAAIVCCVQFQCSIFCVLPLGIGVYTIVVLVQESVRRYLQDSAPGFLVGTP